MTEVAAAIEFERDAANLNRVYKLNGDAISSTW